MDEKINEIIGDIAYYQDVFYNYKKGVCTIQENAPTSIKYPICFKNDNKKEFTLNRN